MEKENKEKKRPIPLIPLDDVLDWMMDEDEFMRMAGKAYYDLHYSNSLQNDRPSK